MAEKGVNKDICLAWKEQNDIPEITAKNNISPGTAFSLIKRSSVRVEREEKYLMKDSDFKKMWKVIVAAQSGDVTEAQTLMKNDKQDNRWWPGLGITPLVATLRAGHINAAKSLIQSGIQINERLCQGKTALALAVAEDLYESVCLLVNCGAKTNLADDSGVTPLMVAAKQGSLRVVELLVSHQDCIVDQVDFAGRTALAYAATSGNVEIAERLLMAGADPSWSDNKGETILMFATRAICLPLVNLLLGLEVVKINEQNKKGYSALMLSIWRDSGNYTMTKRFIEAGADLHLLNRWQESTLMLACSAGLLSIADILTSRGADLNAKNIWGETPLMLAAENGHPDVVALLLKRGSRINERDERNYTALMHAVKSLRVTVIEPPIQRIHTVNQICNDIYTCRSISESSDTAEVLSLLLEVGSDVQAKNHFGQTAIMIAAMHGRVNLVEDLVKKSETQSETSIINMRCNHKLTALSYAAVCGHLPVIKQLLKYETFRTHMPEEVCQAINMAVICDYPEIVSALLEAQLLGDLQPWEQLKLLDQSLKNACRMGKTDSAKLLLEYLTDVATVRDVVRKWVFLIPVRQGHIDILNLFDKVFFKKTAVWAAFIFGRIECLEAIHRSTENVNKCLELWKKTPSFAALTDSAAESKKVPNQRKISWSNLLDAVSFGDEEMVKFLLQQDASMVNKSSATGLTALIYACLYGHKNVVGELIAKSARLDMADINGCSPLMYAARFGHANCVQLLLRAGCNLKQICHLSHNALTLASKMGHEEIVQMLLISGMLCIPRRLVTPLHYAASGSHKRIIELLLKYRFDVNQVNENKQTPLMCASYDGDESCTALLLKLGADRDRSDRKGRTALSFAAETGKIEVVKLLLENGCSILKADKNGSQPIWHAAKNGYLEIVEELLYHEISIIPRTLKFDTQNIQALTVNNTCKLDGSTPLMHMSRYGFHKTVAYLWDKGTTTDTTNNSGQTALHIAAMNNRYQVCEVLLKKFPDAVYVVDKHGKTPLLLALLRGHSKIVSLMEKESINIPIGPRRQVEFSVENSAQGSTYLSFKSRIRMSFRRRSTRKKKTIKIIRFRC